LIFFLSASAEGNKELEGEDDDNAAAAKIQVRKSFFRFRSVFSSFRLLIVDIELAKIWKNKKTIFLIRCKQFRIHD
jgi:hypothetical protein